MALESVPETNRFGLVLPPKRSSAKFLSFRPIRRPPAGVDRHHLYWPRAVYQADPLARAFRKSPFNVVWISRVDHEDIHRLYDGVPVPDVDVMEGYLDEAKFLKDLNRTVKEARRLETALGEAKRADLPALEGQWGEHLVDIQEGIQRARQLELVSGPAAQMVVKRAVSLTQESALAA